MNKKGFTLIELLAVIVILAVVMVVTIPSVINSMNSARYKQFQNAANAAEEYIQKNYDIERQSIDTPEEGYTNIINALDRNIDNDSTNPLTYSDIPSSYSAAVGGAGSDDNINIKNEHTYLLESAGIKNAKNNIRGAFILAKNDKICILLSANQSGSDFYRKGKNNTIASSGCTADMYSGFAVDTD